VIVSAAIVATIHASGILSVFMRRLYLRHPICNVYRHMPPRGHIDRKKHEVDITERVLEGGLWAAGGHLENARVIELSFDMAASPLGRVQSTVQVQMFGPHDDDRRKR
jgi:hypothetical protein